MDSFKMTSGQHLAPILCALLVLAAVRAHGPNVSNSLRRHSRRAPDSSLSRWLPSNKPAPRYAAEADPAPLARHKRPVLTPNFSGRVRPAAWLRYPWYPTRHSTSVLSPAYQMYPRRAATRSGPMAARLLAAACLLHALGGVANGGKLYHSAAELWQKNAGTSSGCTSCTLYKMVTDCPLDVMFLLDMSESIPQISYENARNYVANQMKVVSDTFQDTHVGLLAFSEIVHHDIPLQQRNAAELQQLTDRVRSLPQERYGTKLADTLRRARRALTNHSINALVPGQKRGKVLVLVSDGCEDDDRSVEQEGVQAVLDGIYIISVALSHAYLDILKKISVQILEIRTDIDWRSTVACPSSFLPPVLPTEECSNVVIAMDGSDSVRRWEKVMRNYLAYTSMRYAQVDNAMGVVVFGTNVNTQSSATMLPPTKDKRWLAEQIETSLEFPSKRGTGTTAAIEVSTAFLNRLGATSAPLNSIVVITDGPALNPAAARQALAAAAAEGFKIVVIGVGNVTSLQELQAMAGSSSIVLQVASYLDLYALDLAQYLCRGRPVTDCSNLPPCNVPGQTRRPINNCLCQCDDSIVCASGQVLNPATCQCGCRQITCSPGQTLDPVTCVCGRQICPNTCGGGFQQNPQTCQCECRRSCPYGQSLNQATCTCELTSCTRTCNFPYRLNIATCQCVCHLKCPAGQRLNEISCACEPICTRTCTAPYQLNVATCQCECRRTCSSNQRLNPVTCSCEPICTRTCTSPYQLNIATCQCECRRSCSPGQRLNQATCSCEPICTLTCTPPYRLNVVACQCECSRTCNFPYRVNTATCQCECANSCGINEDLNPATCQCTPRVLPCDKTCPPPYVPSSNTSPCDCVCGLTSCPAGYTLNSNTCSCECRRTCPAGLTLNQNTCSCECQRTCPAGTRLNQNSCTCECSRTCNLPYRLNIATCQCECQRTCPAGQRLNPNSCQCECSRTCNFPYRLNTATCQCECQRTCPAGQRLNPNSCQCECSRTCNLPYRLNTATCQCECQRTCPAGQRLNPNSCQCECSRTCNLPYRLNTATCQCECQRTCPAGQRLNPNSCQCECSRTCNLPYRLNIATCQCECQRTCPAGQRLNPNSCQCECSRTCNFPYRLNTATCQCECQRTCPAGQRLNPNSCQCECSRTCNFPYRLNTATCQCECQRTCPAGQRLNPNSCQCECSRTCNLPYRLNIATCQCECSRTCNFPYRLNTATCQCECQRTCSVGERLNPNSCQCEPTCTRTCNSPYRLNIATCQCECSRTCNFPYRLNTATCQCECQRTCSVGERLNPSSCQCEPTCTRTCNSPYRLNIATCQCECSRTCNFPYRLNTATCQCECANTCGVNEDLNPTTCQCTPRTLPCTQTCQSPYYLDTSVCQCVCGLNSCPAGQTLNRNTCSCGCSNTIQCGRGYRFDPQSCSCVPKCSNTLNCPTGTIFNPENCTCERRCTNTLNCPSGSWFNAETCTCEPSCTNTLTCPPGSWFNAATCSCESSGCQPTTCSAGHEFDLNQCRCVLCRQKTPCQAGTYFDEDLCQCVRRCNVVCPADTQLDQTTCQCVPLCNIKCNAFQIVDFASCTCSCPNSCGVNEDQNSQTCTCVPRNLCTLTCPPFAVLDTSVTPCRCVCQRTCPIGQTLNQASCTCETSGCTRTCGVGQILDQRTCTCVPDDAGVEHCSAAEHRCYDNKLAVRDCQGRCKCNCDINTHMGKYCEIPVEPSMCDNCTLNNGHYLAPVVGRCDLYVVCQPLGNGRFRPHVSLCAPGTIFKRQGTLQQCSGLERGGTCPDDPCRTKRTGEKYAHSSHCAKYWECQAGVTVSEGCCPQGQGFDAASGSCRPDANCANDCASGFVSCSDGRGTGTPPQCPYRANPSNPKQFSHRSAPTAFQSCANTDFFNETACLCTRDTQQGCVPYYDIPFDNSTPNNSVALRSDVPGGNGRVGYFNGNSRIILHRFGGSGFYFDYLEVAFRAQLDSDVNAGYGREMAIVSNGDCNEEESVAITLDERNVYFKVKPDGATQAQVVAVPYSRSANGWLDIKFVYEKQGKGEVYQLTGIVNGQSQSQVVSGRIGDRACALQIGHGLGYDSFRGYVDDLKIWTCRHSGSGRTGNNGNGNYGNQGSNTYDRNPYGHGSNTYTG